MFYQAATELAAGQAEQGFSLVKSLLAFDAQSPYSALASMSLADFFLETHSPQLAAPFYLRATRPDRSPAAAYAYYRYGLCLVELTQWQQGMRMLIRALEELQTSASRMEGAPLLAKVVMEDVLALYAQTGAAADAPHFLEALGIPSTITPVYLERLHRGYQQAGRDQEAARLEALLEDLSTKR